MKWWELLIIIFIFPFLPLIVPFMDDEDWE
jgi:hypothetical protein